MANSRDRAAAQWVTIPSLSSSPAEVSGESLLTREGVAYPVGARQKVESYAGTTLEGRYLVESLLGEGGMGSVYLGRHKLIDKRVAIKILRSDLAADPEMTERFFIEAKAASSIESPHIVDISDYGLLPDGAAFFVMEFLAGTSLSGLMGELRVVPIQRLLHIAKQIARGLAAAHARGVVHRDLKPDNVMLVTRGADPDFVKILDFGIAKVGREERPPDARGQRLRNTPLHVSGAGSRRRRRRTNGRLFTWRHPLRNGRRQRPLRR
jgi:serine/threonine-protein kinase